MISVSSVYNDVANDSVYKDANGFLDYNMFNRMSRRAELRLMDWLTGDVTGQRLPASFSNQKTKDWLSHLLTAYSASLDVNGKFTKPEDYYYYDNMFALSQTNNDCEDEETDCEVNIPASKEIFKSFITLLDGDKFNARQKSFIKSLRPSSGKPIAKEIGNAFEIEPKGLAGVTLEYIALPVFAKIVTMVDPVRNDVIINDAASTNYGWSEAVREALIYFIANAFFDHVTERAGKEFNNASNSNMVGK